jgi:hypothetical protein
MSGSKYKQYLPGLLITTQERHILVQEWATYTSHSYTHSSHSTQPKDRHPTEVYEWIGFWYSLKQLSYNMDLKLLQQRTHSKCILVPLHSPISTIRTYFLVIIL